MAPRSASVVCFIRSRRVRRKPLKYRKPFQAYPRYRRIHCLPRYPRKGSNEVPDRGAPLSIAFLGLSTASPTCQDCSSRQYRRCRTSWVVVESFRQLASMLHPSHLRHQVMQRVNQVIPQRVGQPGLVLAFRHGSDVNVVGWEEVLCLLSQFRLHVIKRKPLSAAYPSAVGEERSGPVVHVEIDRPVRDDDVGFVTIQQDFRKLLITLPRHFGP